MNLSRLIGFCFFATDSEQREQTSLPRLEEESFVDNASSRESGSKKHDSDHTSKGHGTNETTRRIGGQAVIEGVMIRNRDVYSIAVRKPDGCIGVVKNVIRSPAQHYKVLRSPFIRGVTVLIENLILGIKSLLYSAELQVTEITKEGLNKEQGNAQGKSQIQSGFLVTLGLIPAIALGVALFVILPNLATHLIGIIEHEKPFLFNGLAGIIRVAIFLLYILVISLIKDIKRTFQYHGAEHKSIFCYEAGKPLTLEEARRFKTLHPRCGTSFIFFVLFITIIVFPLLTVALTSVYPAFVALPLLYRKTLTILLHLIVALPIIASISYELLKLSDHYNNSFIFKVLISPGLFLQRITTKEPDDSQLEVAIEAVKAVV